MPCAQPICRRGRHVATALSATPEAVQRGDPSPGRPGQQRTETGPGKGSRPTQLCPGMRGLESASPASLRGGMLADMAFGWQVGSREGPWSGGEGSRRSGVGGAALLPPVSSEGRSTSSSLSSTAGSWEGMTESCRETGCYNVTVQMPQRSSLDPAGFLNRLLRHTVTHVVLHVTQTQPLRPRAT